MLSKRLASITGMVALLSAFALPAAAQTKWNLPAAYPADNPHSENLVAFAKDVEAATGGKLQIAVHPGASLFKAPEIKRAVQTGQAQMGELLLSIHENEDSLYGIDVVPFVATSFPEAMKLYKASKGAIEKKLVSTLGSGIRDPSYVRWGTIHEFKGMEAPAVILTHISGQRSDRMLDLIYAGATRATDRLVVLTAWDGLD